jgi:hypothetical protein
LAGAAYLRTQYPSHFTHEPAREPHTAAISQPERALLQSQELLEFFATRFA